MSSVIVNPKPGRVDFELRRVDVGTWEFLACTPAAQAALEDELNLKGTGANVRKLTVNGWPNMMAALSYERLGYLNIKLIGGPEAHLP